MTSSSSLYLPQIRISPDNTSPPIPSGFPLLIAPAGAYLPDHVPQCQPRHVAPSCCSQSVPPGGWPASAAPLPGAPTRCSLPGALPAAASNLSKWQQGKPSLQPLPAGWGWRLWDHPGVSVLSGATKEKWVQWNWKPALAEIQTEWPRGPTRIRGISGLWVSKLSNR